MARSFRIPSRNVRSLLWTAAAVALASNLVAGRVNAAAGGPFLSHQALYELSLVKSRGSNSINSARGRILYNFSGSACEGYTSEFRQVSELDSGEGKLTLSDLRSTSWEDGAGKSYRFKIDARMNDADSSPVDGVAERTGDHITVKLKQPVAKTFTLDGSTVFPTEQIQRIIQAADRDRAADPGRPDHRGARSFYHQRCDEIADALAGDGELLRPRRQGHRWRADAGLCDVVRIVRERRLPGAGARLQRFCHFRRARKIRRQGHETVSTGRSAEVSSVIPGYATSTVIASQRVGATAAR